MKRHTFLRIFITIIGMNCVQNVYSQETDMSQRQNGINQINQSQTNTNTMTKPPMNSNTTVSTVQSVNNTTKTGSFTAEHPSLSTEEIFSRLKAGNQRFVAGNMKNRDWIARVTETAMAQAPYAIVLSCMDSRTPPEIIFDQGIGDIFAIRVAGNIQNDDVIGSMEFGTKVAGAKLIAVIGHTNCGAILGACEQAKLGLLTNLLEKIEPAVRAAKKGFTDTSCQNENYVNQVARENVLFVIKQIQSRSAVIRKLIEEGKLGIVGGIQDLSTGQVTFFDEASIMPVIQTPIAPSTHINNVQPSKIDHETSSTNSTSNKQTSE